MNSPPTDFSTVKNFFNSVELVEGQREHWRTKAKLCVRGSPNKPLIGLFKEGTHEVVDLVQCIDHHPSIDAALAQLRKVIMKRGIIPYDEKTLQGHLRYVQLVCQRSSGLVELSLVANGENGKDALLGAAKELWETPAWHSIWINIQEGSTNTIFGKKWIHLYGNEDLWEEIGGISICFHPGTFSQANLTLFEKILEDIQKQILPGKKVVELYAGVGMIGLTLLEKSEFVTFVESNPLCLPCFEKSAARLNASNYTYIQGDAKKQSHVLEECEVLIVDPPRKGIDASLMQTILSTDSLEQLIYVSCGADSFVRDAKKLLDAHWKLTFIRCYHLFPGTDHVETLAIFKRTKWN